MNDPPLNFAMQSGGGEISRVSHLGIEVDSEDEMMKWQKDLTEKGLVKLIESDTKCCFARQDKVWFGDPDGNEWEVFYVREQLPVTVSARVTLLSKDLSSSQFPFLFFIVFHAQWP